MRAKSFSSTLLLLLASGFPLPSLAVHREIWYSVTYATANPDGLQERRVIGVNGTWPPPIIELNANDSLTVHAHNGLDVSSGIHHHGLFFNSTPWNDGAIGVTQCPIPPDATYDYFIDTKKDGQTGTYWWHGHSRGQYVDGLRAPFIIHNTPEAYKYDEEYIVSLFDWYHDEHPKLLGQFLSEANPTGAEPVPQAGIILIGQNGKYLPGYSENSTIPFKPGKTYRLRIINMSALSMFSFWIDGHNMTVIEVDGTDTQQFPIDQVTVSAAQRISVLVTAKNATDTNYLAHANMSPDMFDKVPADLVLNLTTTILYNAAAPTAPETTVDAYMPFPDEQLVPLTVEAQATAEQSITLGAYFDTASDGTNRAFFNNITYVPPKVPTFLTTASMGANAAVEKVYGQTNTFILESGKNIELVIINWDAGFHPFHLHGHKFQVVGTSMDVSSSDPAVNPPLVENQANPMRRDTIMVPPGGSRTIRFRADNPGTWFFHCHIEWHLESGLAAVFVEGVSAIQSMAASAPAQLNAQCSALGISTTGNAAGKNSTSDFSGLDFGPYPQELGFHAGGIGALAACIIAALAGLVSVAWYAVGGELDEDEMELEVAEAIARKQAKGSKLQRAKRLLTSIGKPAA